MSEPDDVFSMTEGAIGVHEVYLSYRKAGFGKWAALWLVACLTKGVPLPEWFADRLRDMEDE